MFKVYVTPLPQTFHGGLHIPYLADIAFRAEVVASLGGDRTGNLRAKALAVAGETTLALPVSLHAGSRFSKEVAPSTSEPLQLVLGLGARNVLPSPKAQCPVGSLELLCGLAFAGADGRWLDRATVSASVANVRGWKRSWSWCSTTCDNTPSSPMRLTVRSNAPAAGSRIRYSTTWRRLCDCSPLMMPKASRIEGRTRVKEMLIWCQKDCIWRFWMDELLFFSGRSKRKSMNI
eukprot:s180_g18.t1